MGELSAFRLASTQKAIVAAPKPLTDAEIVEAAALARSALEVLEAVVAVAKSTEIPGDDNV